MTYQLSKLTTVCPSCGRRTFKPFVDEYGKMLDPSCGRCNREIKCGYFLPLKQYFAERKLPRLPVAKAQRHLHVSSIQPVNPSTHQPVHPSALPNVSPPIYMDFIHESRETRRHRLMAMLLDRYDEMSVWRPCYYYNIAFADYKGGATLFWLRDYDGNYRSGKIMVYDDHGHRVKNMPGATQWVHTLYHLPDFHFESCFFGSHLLKANDHACVVLVESEKTAMLLALYITERNVRSKQRWFDFPEFFIPMATGGLSNLSIDPSRLSDPYYRWSPLQGRLIMLIPDVDGYDRWATIMQEKLSVLNPKGIEIVDIRQWGATGSMDIGDLILDGTDIGDLDSRLTAGYVIKRIPPPGEG